MEVKKIHVGNLVREAVNQSGYSLSEVARKIGHSRQSLNNWLSKEDLLVKDLFTISQAINIDIVKKFCLPCDGEEQQETKVILHIEVERDKVNEVLKVIKDKHLYNILKK